MSGKKKSAQLLHANEKTMKIYRREWERKLSRHKKKAERAPEAQENAVDELIEHVGYDAEQLGREK